MRKTIFVLLFVAGCDASGDEMNLRNAYREIMLWGTGSSTTIPNRDGCEMIALGSKDTTGAVLITPRIPQAMGGANSFIVAARAPFIGWLEGPLDVTPIGGVEPLSADNQLNPDVLDLLVFPAEPYSKPERAPYVLNLTTTSTPAVPPATATRYVRVRGRKRVLVTVQTAGNTTITISAYQLVNSTLVLVDTKTAAATSQLSFQPNPNIQGDSTADPGYDVIDYMSINAVGSTYTAIGVEAWD